MTSINTFKRMFNGVTLDAEDLFLLESFQISYLPGWVSEREFAAVLWAYPSIKRFLVTKDPPIAEFVSQVMQKFGSADNPQELQTYTDQLVWTIADLLVYSKAPDIYDRLPFHNWDFNEVTSITSLAGKVVIDGGAGTGRVTLETAQFAKHVFAVEPVERLRWFIREKAAKANLGNVFVVDGFLHAIPVPNDFADVLITSHALGWRLESELKEFERVVKKGGFIIHCPGTAEITSAEKIHSRLVLEEWRYQFSRYKESDGWKRKYWKRVRD